MLGEDLVISLRPNVYDERLLARRRDHTTDVVRNGDDLVAISLESASVETQWNVFMFLDRSRGRRCVRDLERLVGIFVPTSAPEHLSFGVSIDPARLEHGHPGFRTLREGGIEFKLERVIAALEVLVDLVRRRDVVVDPGASADQVEHACPVALEIGITETSEINSGKARRDRRHNDLVFVHERAAETGSLIDPNPAGLTRSVQARVHRRTHRLQETSIEMEAFSAGSVTVGFEGDIVRTEREFVLRLCGENRAEAQQCRDGKVLHGVSVLVTSFIA